MTPSHWVTGHESHYSDTPSLLNRRYLGVTIASALKLTVTVTEIQNN